MIELPEAMVLSKQLNESIRGKRIMNVIAAHSPHKFAWYHGDPQKYHDLLADKVIGIADGFGSMVEIKAEDAIILFGEGVGIRFHREDEKSLRNTSFLSSSKTFRHSVPLSKCMGVYGVLKKANLKINIISLQRKSLHPSQMNLTGLILTALFPHRGLRSLVQKHCLLRSKEYPALEMVFCRISSIMPEFIQKGK